jgi:hypothetical protein
MTEFSLQQRNALMKLLKRPPAYASDRLAESFLLKYVFVESLCRLVGRYYNEHDRSGKKIVSKSREPIKIDVVSRSFVHFGIQVEAECLELVLSSSLAKRDKKSARILRNGIVHRWDENDVAEASRRYSSLCRALNVVVNSISHRANGVHR